MAENRAEAATYNGKISQGSEMKEMFDIQRDCSYINQYTC